ncbi:hypothetical protein [Actinoplanes sp. NPDC051494]|uniref:hypothetical protein n=1 Tax=Actinoplanes sp. NPDC051494 TaxID=3363907 RepID=UPI0037B67088
MGHDLTAGDGTLYGDKGSGDPSANLLDGGDDTTDQGEPCWSTELDPVVSCERSGS